MLLVPRIDLDACRLSRRVFIYGTGSGGRKVCLALRQQGITPTGFIDSFKGGETFQDLPVVRLDDYLSTRRDDDRIVIASDFERAIATTLRQHGVTSFESALRLITSRSAGLEPAIRDALAAVAAGLPADIRDRVDTDGALESVIALTRAHGNLSDQTSYSDLAMTSPLIQAITQFLAFIANGAVLEIGTYVGGLTVPLALVARAKNQRMVAVERGGAYETHPFLPTKDIIGDLTDHLAYFGVSEQVDLIQGTAGSPETMDEISKRLAGRSVGLFIDDSNGVVDAKLRQVADILSRNAFLVIDDFIDFRTPRAVNKAMSTRRALYDRIVSGELVEIGVFPYGTWVGYRP